MRTVRADVASFDEVRNSLAALNQTLSKMRTGTVTLNGTTGVDVGDSTVTENTLILLGGFDPDGTPSPAYVSSRTPGTGFQVKGSAGDSSEICYLLIDP